MDENKQLEKVLRGDSSAFAYFVDTYQDMAVTIAYRICRNKQDAEDIAQNAFVKAYRNLHTFRQTGKFSTWLYRIVYNTALSETRGAFQKVEFVDYNQNDADSLADVLLDIDKHEQMDLLTEAMDVLPSDESLMLTLFYIDENTIKDICQITALSESNVKVRLYRARNRLREIMKNLLKRERV